ncbi:Glu-tRNA(Gln) amidotransferase subunit GatE [Candidatus Marsarchaeota archaeon]|nr:Glu-tRNA(Gln) amidotransferase subunit GatE [Candidatus Marsarchaeota archaeon]
MQKDNDYEYYKSLGFMCGLEIHQRLATVEKLFCSCSAKLEEQTSGVELTRKQRAVAGELGEIDRSAKFEELKDRSFKYVISEGHACLVDIDEEPPHEMNRQALNIALLLAASMKMKVTAEFEPMRKEVVDGSNPSAFQRSTLIGLNGNINVNGNDILIPSMFLEEESAGIISNSELSTKYDTSRIGIPLIEIDTFPYIKSPADAKDVALYIGTLLRLTGLVQRGIGSIRQDVNVSIKGGSRIEIKGLQELYDMDKYIENEVKRQQKLIEIIKLLKSRGAKVSRGAKDLTEIFASTESKLISSALSAGGCVMGFKLSNFSGVIGMEVNPNRRLGTEISDYAKMAGVKGIIHSDEEMQKYKISEGEVLKIKEELGTTDKDSFILIAGSRNTVAKAIELAMERASLAMEQVPPETRAVADRDLYTTRFMRPLPGGSRMYPETDTRPIKVTSEMLKYGKENAISVSKERERLKAELGSEDMAERMMLSPMLPLYKELSSMKDADKPFIANMLLQKFREMQRDGVDVESIEPKRMEEIFSLFNSRQITKQAVESLIRVAAKDNSSGITDLAEKNSLYRISGKELEQLVSKELASSKGNDATFIKSFMSKYRLNVDGQELNEVLKKAKR